LLCLFLCSAEKIYFGFILKRLSKEIIHFFQRQGFIIISTIDKNGCPHNSCKGIVKIYSKGQIYLMDLYKARTFVNLKRNPNISISAIDEHKFTGYCLKGRAEIVEVDQLKPDILKAWEDKITSRITHRVLKNIRGDKGHSHHPEVQLPTPEYMISIKVDEIVDLTPSKLKIAEGV